MNKIILKSLISRPLSLAVIASLLMLFTVNISAESGIIHTLEGPVIELSPETLSAVDSGVSLTFICDFAILRTWFFMQWPEQKREHRFVISKHALSDRYLVHQDDKPTPGTFRSSSQGVAFISKSITNLFRNYALEKPETQLRIHLSKYDLPAPIRLSAFTSKNWSFDSGWALWQSAK